jgi:hypothetical protein
VRGQLGAAKAAERLGGQRHVDIDDALSVVLLVLLLIQLVDV